MACHPDGVQIAGGAKIPLGVVAAEQQKKDAESRMNTRFENWKASVDRSKTNSIMDKRLRQQRADVKDELLDGADPEQKEKAESKFVDNEVGALRAKRRQFSTDDFKPMCVLGQGAFGIVHLVREKLTDDLFALKQMSKVRYQRKNYRDRAFAERDCLAAARSRWFVGLVATFQDCDHVYMLMEFVQGGELFKHLEIKTRFTIDETTFYMAELLEALDCVHSHGFVHRDVKPDNIVLTREGHLKLLDFGLCKSDPAEDETDPSKPLCDNPRRARLNSKVGTPQYMSPESFDGEAAAPADIWALGIVLFECLYGGLVFHAGNKEGFEAIQILAGLVQDHKKVLPKRIAKAKALGLLPPTAENVIPKIICDKSVRITAKDLRRDPFFEGLDFENIHLQTPPIIPVLKGPTDVVYFDDFKRHVPLPKPKPGVPKDSKIEWSHYEFNRAACEMEDPKRVKELLEDASEGQAI